MSENDSLKNKTIGDALWKFCERGLAQIINFIVSIVLARMLLPEAYGIIALIMVFITICDKLVSSGFATSLIQKKDADNLDFSTVFYFSIAASVMLYALLFVLAPLIANFYSSYEQELLVLVTRVIGLRIIISAINSVQHAYVSKTMQFRKMFFSTIAGAVISAVIGIVMAYYGMGVWALVAQYLVASIIDTVVLWFTVRWRPIVRFSITRLKGLYAFGWKIFAASMIRTLYNDLRSLVIGKFYTPADLAYYNKGQSFPQIIDTNISGTIDSVMFPAIAKKQSEPTVLLAILRRSVRVSSYILMPLLVGLAAAAESIVCVLLTEKWLDCVMYMQILSFSFILSPVELENLQAIKAIGRSDIVLKLEILKKTVGVLLLVVAIPFGIETIAISTVVGAVFSACANAYPNKKLIGYTYRYQIEDILAPLILSLIMFAVVFPISFLNTNSYVVLILQVVAGVITYTALSWIFKVDSFFYVIDLIKSFLKRRHSSNES